MVFPSLPALLDVIEILSLSDIYVPKKMKEIVLDATKMDSAPMLQEDTVEGTRQKEGDVEHVFEEMKGPGVRLIPPTGISRTDSGGCG